MKTNVKLKSAVAKWDESTQKWFVELTYEFMEDNMVMERIFPKVELPFPSNRLPTILHNSKYAQMLGGRIDGITDLEVTYIDQVVGPIKPKELTIAQIEALLGYKIKIINDKERVI